MGMILNPFILGASGPDSLPHRHWRVLISANQSLDTSCIPELELYASPWGGNIASGGTASASSESSADYVAAKGFDQNPATISGAGSSVNQAWASSNTPPPHWLAYDLGVGNESVVQAVGLSARESAFIGQTPVTFVVQYSDDGSAWTTLWSVSTSAWTQGEHRRFVNPSYSTGGYSGSPHGSHLYWRIFALQSETWTSAVAIGEVEMRATPAGADQCAGGTAAADSEFSGSFVAANAFDNSNTTVWSALDRGNYNWGWIRYQFASAVEVAEVKIRARHDVAPTTSPEIFWVQHSDDGVTWTTAWDVLAQTGWVLSEERVFTDPAYV